MPDEKDHLEKEIEQERVFFSEIKNEMSNKIVELEADKKKLQENAASESFASKEAEQEKVLLETFVEDASIKRKIATKKYYLTIIIAMVILSGIIIPYSLYVTSIIGEEYRIITTSQVTSGYVIQNLKGDIINTWLSWRITEGDILHVNILDAEKYPNKVDIIKKIVLSEDVYEIDDSLTRKGDAGNTSTYYPGWAGALNEASNIATTFYIPKNLEIVDSAVGAGDITIKLVGHTNADGYAGFTKSIADENQNQILKSEITIYDVDSLTDEQFSTILRHELGHAFGLAHSTASEDLMSPEMITEFPYISECDVEAITSLYDNGKLSTVICDK